jgi:subtilisin family serine protease
MPLVPQRLRRFTVYGAPLALLLACAPATAAGSRAGQAALRAALDAPAGAALRRPLSLPLPEPAGPPRASAARVSGGLARLRRPGRVLIGLRSHSDAAAVERVLRGLRDRPEPIDALGVVAARARSPARLVAALRDRVAYVEPDARLRVAADYFDRVDTATGIPFTWDYDAVRAGPALAAAGGGSRRIVAVIDTGADVSHPDLAGRLVRPIDSRTGGADVTDVVGHGTFVAGLVSAVDGNGIGIKGVAGRTRLLPVRASTEVEFNLSAVIDGMLLALDRGADIINLSLAGDSFSRTQARALDLAYLVDALPIAASGNSADQGNPVEYPAAQLGGVRGGVGSGLSVGAVTPAGSPAYFSDHNDFVSLAAPGAGGNPTDCSHGVFSTIPRNTGTVFDDPSSCSLVVARPEGRYAYAEGTSFAAPIASGIAALAWQVEPALASDQVADVLQRGARQTFGRRGWNEYTGWGVVDGPGAVHAARVYDVSPPHLRVRAHRHRHSLVAVHLYRTRDRTRRGKRLAGGVRYSLLVSRDAGRSFQFAVRPRRRAFRKLVRVRGSKRNVLAAVVCDRNYNCASKRFRYRPSRRHR